MNNILSINKDDCCGCTACSSICPCNAIVMAQDKQGFLYPEIDTNKCINCGLCIRVHNGLILYKEKEEVSSYAAKNINKDSLKKSSSGGVSSAIAKHFLEENGIVYGVVFDKDYSVITKRISIQELDLLYGSKYVQTDLKNTFNECFNDLKNGKKVAYFGTSCHIAGLISFLNSKGMDLSNLLTIDLICHGVPSPKIFSDYIDWINKKNKFISYEFRTKEKPWGYGSRNFGPRLIYQSKKGKRVIQTDSMKSRIPLKLFFSNNCLRPYCFSCPFTGLNKPSDITIADYWGCNVEEPDFFSEEGVSAVICNTEKGINEILENKCLIIKESLIDKICRKQGNMSIPSKKPISYDYFWNLYDNQGFLAIAKKYGGYNLKGKIRTSFIHRFYEKIKYRK